MSFLKWLFGVRSIDNHDYFKAMTEMASESERTYKSMIDLYNSEVVSGVLQTPSDSEIHPTGRGIYKARLFGSLFMVMAFAKSGHDQAETEELMNVATGLALEPLQGEGEQHLDREEAETFTMDYLISTFKAMTAAFDAGPWLPGTAQPEHLSLAEKLHEALIESIGTLNYTAEIRERFSHMVNANTALAMNHTTRWMRK